MNELQRLKKNIFPHAWDTIGDWQEFKWHRSNHEIDAYRKHSSQALAIDFFGTLKMSNDRDSILNHLAKSIGLPKSERWSVELEWEDDKKILRETKHNTQVDAVARSDSSIIFFECKFSEPSGGPCSQPKSKQCDGNYRQQVNPKNNKTSFCALSGKGIGYWEAIPRTFNLDSSMSYEPCPFFGSEYQWMRNVVLCSEIATKLKLAPKSLIVYADAPGLPMAKKIRSKELDSFKRLLKNESVFGWVSYQDLLRYSLESSNLDNDTFLELNDWITDKISTISRLFIRKAVTH